MREFWKSSLKHPIKFCAMILFVGVPLVLGWVHEGRIILDCSVPLIRHVKHEYQEWRVSLGQWKHEIATWDEHAPAPVPPTPVQAHREASLSGVK